MNLRLRVSQRAQRVALRVLQDASVELVLPQGVSERQGLAFLESREAWVRQAVARRQALQPLKAEFPPNALDLTAIHERWQLHRAGGLGRARLRECPQGILSLLGQGSAAQWRRLLLQWLQAKAQRHFADQLATLAKVHGFSYQRMRVRAQRSRWGSCSSGGTISLNLGLLFLDPACVQYLMLHELAHTRHMNHSSAFWQCLAECLPNWRALDAELMTARRRVPDWIVRSSKIDD
jgi:predicted metal-dependent hydrolase